MSQITIHDVGGSVGIDNNCLSLTLAIHFYPRERVRIVYTVFASPAQGAKVVGVYRRMTLTDVRGNFTRPAFWAYFDPRNGFAITVTVSGARSDRATTTVGGAP